MKIEILDCTLRDGGYINNWDFKQEKIESIMNNLINSNIDLIEIGFLDERVEEDKNKSIMPNINILNKNYRKV